jgi:LysM repeat protein
MLVRPTSRWRGTFVRSVAAASITIAATLPQALNAQQSAAPADAKTHTVKRGDTLWDIAKSFLGDAYLWPEVYRLNTDVIEDPHWIYPGEQLKLPGDHAKVVAVAPPSAPMPADTAIRPQQTASAPPADAPEPVPSALIPPALRPAVTHDTTTPMLNPLPTAVRVGEYIASPWVDRDGGPSGAGQLIEGADIPGIDLRDHSRFQLHDRVFIAPPSGAIPAPHALYLSYRLGPLYEDFGQIVIPTGIVEVTQPGNPGEASVARVVKMFGEVKLGEKLVPLDTGSATVAGHASAVSNGRMGKVRWILNEPVLASVQSYVVIDMSARDGVATGDQIEIYKPRQRPNDDHSLILPEISIAHGQVLRVTPYGATVMIVAQEQPHIVEGASARVAAKMP